MRFLQSSDYGVEAGGLASDDCSSLPLLPELSAEANELQGGNDLPKSDFIYGWLERKGGRR